MFCASLVLGIHLATYHFDRETKYQEINPGISVACDDWQAGVYYNSYKDVSVYGVKNYKEVVGKVDVAVGVVLGYDAVPVMPMIVPSVKVGKARLSLLIPTKANTGGVHLSYEF